MQLPIPIESDHSRDQAFTAVSTFLGIHNVWWMVNQPHDSECKWKCWFRKSAYELTPRI
ncbi:hypothetical protein SASPL_120426 [Salvia splendens]|uniref:Uncharacterized protein n=1 Tax=Salvia splendens TaxID=180675 RepID=A0A8X8XQH3_SALSN|nr:hypothetical protein SASPL_120426 [Salvia splendens]